MILCTSRDKEELDVFNTNTNTYSQTKGLCLCQTPCLSQQTTLFQGIVL